MPAVRGYRKVTITALQVSAGLVSASTVALVVATMRRVLWPATIGTWPVVLICLLTGLGDVSYRRWRRPRPVALHRQVPRHWGHEKGPWRASLRYGLRMGVGAATILTTWTWWAALGICALGGTESSVIGGAVYVTVRFVVSSLSSVGIVDGTAMAQRSRVLDSMRTPVERAAVAAPFLALFGLILFTAAQ